METPDVEVAIGPPSSAPSTTSRPDSGAQAGDAIGTAGQPEGFRSGAWFRDPGKDGFIARSHLGATGVSSKALRAGPVIGICTSWSELTPCNAHLGQLSTAVRRGITRAGGVALEFPTMSLGEPLMRPTTMLFRSLMAMDVEESIRANPIDAVVLLSSCDKTVPAQVMGASSVDLPTILLTGGPMLSGRFRGKAVGSGTDVWRSSEQHRAGELTDSDMEELERCLTRSAGHRMTMGTASTMACLTESLGIQLSGAAALPAVDSRRLDFAERTGQRIVEMARAGGPLPSQIMTRRAFGNAIKVNAAIGGSTNAVLHLLAIAGRLEVPLTLDDFTHFAAAIPLLVDLQPSGRYLMEDLAYAGGLPAVLSELAPHLDLDVTTVDTAPLADLIAAARCHDRAVVTTLDEPVLPAGRGTAVLRGNLAPSGAVLKVSAASEHLLQHRGPALVYDRVEDYLAVADDEDLEVTVDTVLVVRNAGPLGYPGMPEIANLPIPGRLLREGVTDMVRISDGRMSGTGYGTVVLHVAPEAAVGGPLSVVRTGDIIELDAAAGRLHLDIEDEELGTRLAEWEPCSDRPTRGWLRLYAEHVTQADRGADLDVLAGSSGHAVPRSQY